MKRFIIQMSLISLAAICTQTFTAAHIQQIRVTQQTGNSCGYHATYNAKAVETLVLEGKKLTEKAIIQEARHYKNFIQKDAILGDTIIDLANQLDMNNVYCIDGRRGLAFAGASAGAQDGNAFLRDLATQKNYDDLMIGHFIVNTGGHWVTFSVIQQNNQTTIIYMDSINTPLSRNRTAQAVGNALLARINGKHTNNYRTEKNSRSGRNFGNHRNKKQPDREMHNYVDKKNDDAVSLSKITKNNEFPYKTCVMIGILSFLIGFKLGQVNTQ